MAAPAERPCVETPACCARRDRRRAHVGCFICDSDIRLLRSREIRFVVESGPDWRRHMPFRGCFVPAGENNSQSNETQLDLIAGRFRDLQVHAESNVLGFRAGSAWVGRIPGEPGSACFAPRVRCVYRPLPNPAGRTCACLFVPTRVFGVPGEGAAMGLTQTKPVQTVRFSHPWASQSMEYLIGVVLAAVVCASALLAGFDRERVFYRTLLTAIAGYSILFGARGVRRRQSSSSPLWRVHS